MVEPNFGIIIQARLNSKRFPKKILKRLDGKNTVLEFQISRISKVFDKKNIFVATTLNKEDIKICRISKKNHIRFFKGSEKNVIKRYIDCAKKFKIKTIIRVTSDCPLVDPKLIKKMLNKFSKIKCDYFSNTYPLKDSTFPDGTDIEIFKLESLIKAYNIIKDKNDREHVTTFFWKKRNIFNCKMYKLSKNLSDFRFCIDYKDDLILMKKIIKHLKEKNLFGNVIDITNFLKKNKTLNNISQKNKIKVIKYRKDLY
tara:strand:+ start:1018 stop:1785 length:768 start_codon:yes stop_codon:yes gene_type:complete